MKANSGTCSKRLAFISQFSHYEKEALSGTNDTILKSLLATTDISVISGFRQRPNIYFQLLSKLSQRVRCTESALPYHTWENVCCLSTQIQARSQSLGLTHVICPSSIVAAACKFPKSSPLQAKVLIYTDATVKALAGYYPEWHSIHPRSYTLACQVEAFAFSSASRIVVASEWAADSVRMEYGVPACKVVVIPRAANLDHDPSPPSDDNIEARRKSVKLITIGRSWHRKRMPMTVAVTEELRRRGIMASLTIIGLDAQNYIRDVPSYIISYPRINKENPTDKALFSELMSCSSIFLFLSKAEAMGISLTEACAYSLPIVSCNTGGISTVVRTGLNGWLGSESSSVSDYADSVQSILNESDRYLAMSRFSYAHYLNFFRPSDLGMRLMAEVCTM